MIMMQNQIDTNMATNPPGGDVLKGLNSRRLQVSGLSMASADLTQTR